MRYIFGTADGIGNVAADRRRQRGATGLGQRRRRPQRRRPADDAAANGGRRHRGSGVRQSGQPVGQRPRIGTVFKGFDFHSSTESS